MYSIHISKYAFETRRSGKPKYGKEIVMFITSGILVHHHGDEEPQAIFWGPEAKNFVYIWKNEDNWAVGERPHGNPIFQSDDVDAAANWVVKNYEQYRKTLRPKNERPTGKINEVGQIKLKTILEFIDFEKLNKNYTKLSESPVRIKTWNLD